ncbi:hypothetical protein [Terasakiella sp.]|uniref:hypothetical protein n=1 Tax=Terasakiella sp. TaxID=2034861 RepID=UPI003AA8C43B
MPLKVRVNDKKVNGQPLRVGIPGSPGSYFKNGEDFDLTDNQLKDPDIVRLLPRSYPGGRFGDLQLVKTATVPAKKGSKA